ncbi:Maf family protein [Leptospira sp. 96542]|nr:Maf family protein [Leptospira sp. 96542]
MFILKSNSPRRMQILENLGLRFQVESSNANEDQFQNENHLHYLERMVYSKLGQNIKEDALYLTADTIVVYQGEILHKPTDEADAKRILSLLSAKTHSVFSGICLATMETKEFFYEETRIQFKTWGSSEIEMYIKKYQPYDKAGSYGIQDEAGPVLERVGSYSNVLGFPLRSFLQQIELWKQFTN